MTAPEITFALLDGSQPHAEEVEALQAEVYPEAAGYPARFRVQRRQPGFVLAEARHGGFLVGYASGMPLRPSTDWWRHLTTPLPEKLTAEHQGRTFALLDLLVRPSWRRQGIAGSLHDLILTSRPEERATLTVPPTATAAQQAFRKWGWRKIARTRGPGDTAVSDLLIVTLSGQHQG